MTKVEDFELHRLKKNSRFCGYVIASESEEFLVHFEEIEDFYVRKAWAITPMLAFRYTLPQALDVFEKLKKDVSYRIWILELFETEDNLFLASDAEDQPPWL